MDDRVLHLLEKLGQQLDKLDHRVVESQITLGKQQVILDTQQRSLDEHIRRTELLEMAVSKINRHVSWVEGVIKFLGLLGLIGSVIVTYVRVFA